jgi:hypothetical protein
MVVVMTTPSYVALKFLLGHASQVLVDVGPTWQSFYSGSNQCEGCFLYGSVYTMDEGRFPMVVCSSFSISAGQMVRQRQTYFQTDSRQLGVWDWGKAELKLAPNRFGFPHSKCTTAGSSCQQNEHVMLNCCVGLLC